MSFLPFSLNFSYEYEIVVQQPRQTKHTSNKVAQLLKRSPGSTTRSAASDSSERLLSPLTQQLQDEVRARMRAKLGGTGDAVSLSLLKSTEESRCRQKREVRLRESAMDEESLAVLVRATAEPKDHEVKNESSTDSSKRRSSSSSFDDLGPDTPCPSPRMPSSSPSDSKGKPNPLDGSGPRKEIARSIAERRERREASKIWQESSQVRPSGVGSVAELLRHYEELEGREEGLDEF